MIGGEHPHYPSYPTKEKNGDMECPSQIQPCATGYIMRLYTGGRHFDLYRFAKDPGGLRSYGINDLKKRVILSADGGGGGLESTRAPCDFCQLLWDAICDIEHVEFRGPMQIPLGSKVETGQPRNEPGLEPLRTDRLMIGVGEQVFTVWWLREKFGCRYSRWVT
jgi:hypothetical protein